MSAKPNDREKYSSRTIIHPNQPNLAQYIPKKKTIEHGQEASRPRP
jgi:bifunctional ADP-heptose synthase (sugar kinase/adenylyltransferase)